MKTSRRHPFGNRGIALVIVLAFVTLIASLVVAYFTSATNELSSSRSYSTTTDTKMLADTAVELVTGQIREATAPLPKGAPLAWTSQPGMIRVFGTPTAASSQPYAYYKLYSSDKMVVTKDFNTFNPQNEVAGFVTSPDLYTDLNKPVMIQDDRGTIPGPDGKKYRADYPIFDPSAVPPALASPTTGIEGIGLGTNSPGLTAPPLYSGTIPPLPTYNPATNPNPAPMPVRWLYVLRDGRIAAPTSAAGGISTFDGPIKPTKQNPIVGRVAFWADDETSKLNINTASEATYWDTPLTASFADSVQTYTGLGQFQPSAGEYQRYPGHPATTCLSPVFGRAMGWQPPVGTTPINYADGSYLALKETLYALIPRVNSGGSSNGSIPASSSTGVPPEGDRLYASVDELLYKPTLNPPVAGNFALRQVNLRMSTQLVQQARFFLTPTNRAPELNLFGRPRISIWPVHPTASLPVPSLGSAKDNVFAFCSTIGSKSQPVGNGCYPFFFARSDSKSPDKDYQDTTRGGRNVTLYKYLQNLTSVPVPGFGGSNFLAKYPNPHTSSESASDRDQILTEIFDYIRCVNLSDGSNTGGTPFTPSYASNGSDYAGQITPIRIEKTRGFGRFPTVSEAAVIFTLLPRDPAKPTVPDKMRAVLVLEAFTPSFGWIGMKDTYCLRVDSPPAPGNGLNISDPTTSNRVDLFPASATNTVTVGVHNGPHGRFLGGHLGFGNQFFNGPSSVKKVFDRTGSGIDAKYPFVSDPIDVPLPVAGQPARTFSLSGSITVSVLPTRNPGDAPVQTIKIDFPNTRVRVPTQVSGKTYVEFEKRVGAANNTDAGITATWLTSDDAVRSVEAKTDLRLIAGRSVVNNANGYQYFGPAGDPALNRWVADFTNASTLNVLHSLHTALGPRYVTAVKTGVFVAQGSGPTYTYPNYKWDASNPAGKPIYKSASDNQARMADLPEELRGGVYRVDGGPGDWDSGVSKMYDGAFINKPDEGESSDGTSIPYFLIADFKGAINTLYSPNRIIASPGWFGSLPSGLQRNHPWETLLFRPDFTSHPGLVNPPDHLLLDLFNMPVVEPYPISEPFSQNGKVNLNYQIMPFAGYLKRSTALRGVLRAEKFLAIPFLALNGGKTEANDGSTTDYRHQIDEDTTLAFLERRWTDTANPGNQVFRSASQICELNLYPKPNSDTTAGNNAGIPVATAAEGRGSVDVTTRWRDFWGKSYALTGDNAKERPYARLYARLTTKSNTFTVHLRVQSLLSKPNSSAPANTWDENNSTIAGDYRGSAMIERYLDPADRRFNPNDKTVAPEDRINPDQDSLETAYRFRVLNTKQFAP